MAHTTTQADVSTPAQEYNQLKETWAMVQALLGGTRTMREAGAKYLPQFAKESDPNYSKRLGKAVLVNAYKQAIRDLVGLPFSKPPKLSEDFSTFATELVKDVTLSGMSLHGYARHLFKTSLGLGGAPHLCGP